MLRQMGTPSITVMMGAPKTKASNNSMVEVDDLVTPSSSSCFSAKKGEDVQALGGLQGPSCEGENLNVILLNDDKLDQRRYTHANRQGGKLTRSTYNGSPT